MTNAPRNLLKVQDMEQTLTLFYFLFLPREKNGVSSWKPLV
jgi:hypothetical protein